MMDELILRDAAMATPLRVCSLRYFNPIGADPALRTGLQLAAPTHALGALIDAHLAGRPFAVTGTRWPTRDGSGIRDYVHVWDLARAHVAALRYLADTPVAYEVINLGTGTGTTVRELVAAFHVVTGGAAEVVEAPARPGDVVGSYTRTAKAERVLGWRAEKTIEDGVRDALAWTRRRPGVLGY
jgi:UDP-glucose 4-epimerase